MGNDAGVSANESEPAQRSGQRASRRRSTGGVSARQAASAAATPRALAPTTVTTEAQSPAGRDQPQPPDDLRERVWTLHLRGASMRQIALRLSLNRKVVARLLGECEREFGAERRARLKRKLEGAIARMRHIQSQAWDDHDTDDEREQAIIKASSEEAPGTRYQSQRSQYLRLALDAEKEIARLEGLYADDVSDLAAVLFSVERVVGGVVVKRQSARPAVPVVEEGDGDA